MAFNELILSKRRFSEMNTRKKSKASSRSKTKVTIYNNNTQHFHINNMDVNNSH